MQSNKTTRSNSMKSVKTATTPRVDPQVYLKSPPKTDYYLLFALLALFMTMVLM